MQSEHELVSRIEQLERIVAKLATSNMDTEYVEGWESAARLCGISSVTLRRKVADGEVSACSVSMFGGESRTLSRPVFRLVDLRNWREGRSAGSRKFGSAARV